MRGNYFYEVHQLVNSTLCNLQHSEFESESELQSEFELPANWIQVLPNGAWSKANKQYLVAALFR